MPATTINGRNVPIRMWAPMEEVDSKVITQLKNVAALPWVAHHVAVMPDVHLGKGATVGSVIAMRGAVAPAAVGVDIGCGMAAVETSLTSRDLPDDLRRLRLAIEAAIPVGWHGHDGAAWQDAGDELRATGQALMDRYDDLGASVHPGTVNCQIGTLGGGNHFIEVCLDTKDTVWLMLHSGSRNIGKTLAEHHMQIAQRLRHNQALEDRDLAVFLAGTPQFDAYRRDLFWAQEYARFNRQLMLHLLAGVVRHFWPRVTLGAADLVPPQLRRRGGPLRRRPAGDAQGGDPRRPRRAGHHPGIDGHEVVHRPRPRQPRVVRIGVTRRRPPHEPDGGAQALQRRRISNSRPKASSAARTPASSTRRRRPTRTSTA